MKKKEGRKFGVEKMWKRDQRQLLLSFLFFAFSFFSFGVDKVGSTTGDKIIYLLLLQHE